MVLRELLPENEITCGNAKVAVDRVTRDPLDCGGAALFCLWGKSFDPEQVIGSAIGCGARALVTDRELPYSPIPTVTVKNARRAYAYAYSAFCGSPQKNMRFIGITGTNGKTSTSYFLHSLLTYCGVKNALIGTTGIIYDGEKIPFPSENSGISQMTTPDPEIFYPLLAHLCSLGVHNVVMEVSSHSLALSKLDPIEFDIGLFTNITPEHLDFHGDMEQYAAAKAKLAGLSRKVVFNGDDPVLWELFKSRSPYSYGVERGMYRACCVRDKGVDGSSYLLRSDDCVLRMESSIPGDFTVINSLAAVSAAIEWGISPEVAVDAVSAVKGIPGRLERIPLDVTKYPFSVLIDYAHTPDALEKLLCCKLFKSRKGRLITLFGCGGDRDKTKRAPMGRIASDYSDTVYVTSDNSRSESPEEIIHDILRGIEDKRNFIAITDREQAIRLAFRQCKKDDILLLVGKGHENYIVDRDGRRYFSEKEIVLSEAARGSKRKGK